MKRAILFSLLLKFYIASFAQVNEVKEKHFFLLLDSCLQKQLEIISCDWKKVDSVNIFPNYVAKVQIADNQIIISNVNVINPNDILHEGVNYYYKFRYINVFLKIPEDIIKLTSHGVSSDQDIIKKVINRYMDQPPSKEVSGVFDTPYISLFKINQRFLVSGKGTISYQVIQPVKKVERRYWPVKQFSASDYNILVDTIGEGSYGPWKYCYKYQLSESQIENMKNGSIRLKIQKE